MCQRKQGHHKNVKQGKLISPLVQRQKYYDGHVNMQRYR